jgi:hypothetical protein
MCVPGEILPPPGLQFGAPDDEEPPSRHGTRFRARSAAVDAGADQSRQARRF